MATRGWESATPNDVRDRRAVLQKPSKYRNVKTVVDGIVFDSKAEAARWQELKAAEHCGAISDLKRQVEYPLYCPVVGEGAWAEVCRYKADFVYIETGQRIIEDKKGKKTAMYLLKRKWLALQNGIKIRET